MRTATGSEKLRRARGGRKIVGVTPKEQDDVQAPCVLCTGGCSLSFGSPPFQKEPIMSISELGATKSSVTVRLQSATSELRELEQLVKSGDLDARVLSEFRNAVDFIRSTAWAVQQWVGLTEKTGGDPYSVLPILSAERVRRATQLTSDVSLDLQASEIGAETEGVRQLFEAVDDLHRRLGVLLKRED
jgi:hypothetical protein